MTQFGSPEDDLQLARSIVREWKGFSGEVLLYDASLGITGRLFLLFSSLDERYFLIRCGPCYLFETTFKWQVDRLEINMDSEAKTITIVDRCANLQISTRFLAIEQFLKPDAVSNFYNLVYSQRELSLPLPSLQNLNSTQQLERSQFNIPGLSIDYFKAYNNILKIGLRYVAFNKKSSSDDYQISLLLRKPIYLYFLSKYFNLKEIKIQSKNNIFRITDDLERYLWVECQDIKLCDTMEWILYDSSIAKKINWFSLSTIFNLQPKHIISLEV